MADARTAAFIVRLTPDLDQRLAADAAANERSKAATVRLALERYLSRPNDDPETA
jgi:predicted DNA-binding protein